MSEDRDEQKPSLRLLPKGFVKRAIVFFAFTTVVLGAVAFVPEAAHDSASATTIDGRLEAWSRAFYNSARMLVLETGDETTEHGYLLAITLARISALLFAGFVAYGVIVKVFAQRLQLWCARRCGNTTILVGRGVRGAGVLKTLREDRSTDAQQGWFQRFLARVNPERWERPLIVVDKSAAVVETAVADDRLIAVHADVDEAESLTVIGAEHAKRVFVVTPDDDLNLRVATSVIDAWGKQSDANVNGAAPLRECYVHVRDVETLELAYKIRALETSPPSVDVRLFSSHEL